MQLSKARDLVQVESARCCRYTNSNSYPTVNFRMSGTHFREDTLTWLPHNTSTNSSDLEKWSRSMTIALKARCQTPTMRCLWSRSTSTNTIRPAIIIILENDCISIRWFWLWKRSDWTYVVVGKCIRSSISSNKSIHGRHYLPIQSATSSLCVGGG